MKRIDVICIAILILGTATLAVVSAIALMPEEEVQAVSCGSGLYLEMDTYLCFTLQQITPDPIIEEKIVEKIITESLPMNTIRGLSDTQNIFVTYSGEDSIVSSQTCDGLTVLVNPVMTTERDGSFVLRDSVSGMKIYLDKASAYQYDIATVPKSGEQHNTVGKELTRSSTYTVQCDNKVVDRYTTSDAFYYAVQLASRDKTLRVDGDVGKIVNNKRSITGMIVLYENGRIQSHMQSFDIDLDNNGGFSETVNVDGYTDSGKRWRDNVTYTVQISYDGDQVKEDFRK